MGGTRKRKTLGRGRDRREKVLKREEEGEVNDLYEVDSDAEEDARVQSRNRRALEDEDINYIAGTRTGEEDSDVEIGEDDDEEIDSDEAFDSEDEEKFGDFDFAKYGSGGKGRGGGESESDDDGELSSEEEEEDSESEERHRAMIASLRQMREDGERAEGRSGGPVAPTLGDESQQEALTLSDLVGTWKESQEKPTSRSRKLEKSLKRMTPTAAPLPKIVQERNERKAAYSITSKDVSKWQNIVKANREARTLEFSNRQAANLQVVTTTTGLADKVKPENEMEKEIAEMLGEEMGKAAEEDQLLPSNTLTKEELKERQAKLAKMRSVLFYQDQKAKRLKAIKSKRHHKYLKKVEQRKIEKEGIDMDPEAMRKEVEHAEYLRARERLTLKHKNTSKWAKHALQRGFHRLDDSTKTALSEQNRISEALRRKVNYQDESEDYSSSEEESDNSQDKGKAMQKVNNKAKADVLKLLEENPDAEAPKKGLFSLPFMKRAMDKKKEEARQNAEDFLMELEDSIEEEESSGDDKVDQDRGKLSFGRKGNKVQSRGGDDDSGSESSGEEEDEGGEPGKKSGDDDGVKLNYGHTIVTRARSRDESFKASQLDVPEGKARQAQNSSTADASKPKRTRKKGVASADMTEDEKVYLEDEENEGPHLSQRQIVSQAFGAFGDDVQTDFQQDKLQNVVDELPAFDEPADLPGWGKWEGDRKTPKWILKARANAEAQRKEAIASRQDRKLKHVVISERYDKKASKYTTTAVPFPFKTRADYERSIRTPLGSDFNSDKSHRDLTRPEVLTTTGVRIDPLSFTKTNSHPRKEGGISGVRKV